MLASIGTPFICLTEVRSYIRSATCLQLGVMCHGRTFNPGKKNYLAEHPLAVHGEHYTREEGKEGKCGMGKGK